MADAREAPKAVGVDTHAPSSAAAAAGGVDQAREPGADRMPTGDVLGAEDLLPLAIPEPARRGAGRPKGSRNIRTEQTARAIIGRYGDPLIASAAIGNMPLPELARWLRTVASDVGLKLGLTVGDLLRFQEECRRNAMPYLHAKRAAEDGAGEPVLPVFAIGHFQQTNVQVNAGARSAEDIVELQALSEASEGTSHDDTSHDDATD